MSFRELRGDMDWGLYDPAGHRKYLTEVERAAFMKAAKECNADVMTLCWALNETGCRLSEALELTLDHVDFPAGMLVFRSLKKRGAKMHRAVPVSPQLLKAIRRLGENSDTKPLWPWCRMTAYRRVKEVMARAGIHGPHASPKGLRHGFGVAALERGVPLNLLQKWLGHARLSTTAIYGNAVGAEERKMASKMWN